MVGTKNCIVGKFKCFGATCNANFTFIFVIIIIQTAPNTQKSRQITQ